MGGLAVSAQIVTYCRDGAASTAALAASHAIRWPRRSLRGRAPRRLLVTRETAQKGAGARPPQHPEIWRRIVESGIDLFDPGAEIAQHLDSCLDQLRYLRIDIGKPKRRAIGDAQPIQIVGQRLRV